VTAEIFSAISGRDNPVGLGAVIQQRWTPLKEIAAGADDIVVALFETSEPGNLGTILRTMDAVGADGMVLVGDTVDPFHPSAVKASMGAIFSVKLAQAPDSAALFRWANDSGLQSVATSAKADDLYSEARYELPALLLMGNEGRGLPGSVIAASTLAVTIPMSGRASSLNLAVAAGLLLYEIRRRSGNV
jgi:TrmH family RNA methyltransferase